MKRFIHFALIVWMVATTAIPLSLFAATWYVRPSGGTRYDATYNPTGQCTGLADADYPGTGVEQPCAFNEVQYLWDVGNSPGGVGGDHIGWVISGGDTVNIHAGKNYRIGWDANTGAVNKWCPFVGNQTCYNPPIPAGTLGAHTKIYGDCVAAVNCTPINNNYPYGSTNEAQLFGGYGLTWVFNLSSTHYVDIAGIELTTHNAISSGNPGFPGNCTFGGSPAYKVSCANNQPLDDYAQNGFLTDNATANVTFTDVLSHGFNSSGMFGPIGGAITMTRVFMGFNGFAGWNLADVSDTPNAAGSSINANYITLIGNGCYEEYPIVHTQFPARACYDDLSGLFGDQISGQDSPLDTMIWNHGYVAYGTKDGFIGPHTQIKHLTITNSAWIGNMGQAVKFGTDTSSDVTFLNNVVYGGAYRMSQALPGAAQNFALSTGLPGSYLSDFGRAAGDVYSLITQAGSNLIFAGNTSIINTQTAVDFNCGKVDHAGNVTGGGTCGSVPIVWKDNIFIGWINPDCTACAGLTPGLWFAADPSINFTSTFNSEFGIRNGDPCGGTIICSDPLLTNQPSQTWPGEAAFDVYLPLTATGFYPTGSSPVIGVGSPVAGMTADFYGNSRTNPPWLGAVNVASTATVAAPTFSPVAGTYVGTQTVTISTVTAGATLCYTTDGSTPAASTPGTCSHGTTYSTPVSITSSLSLKAIGTKAANTNSTVSTAAYVITAAAPAFSPGSGTYPSAQSVTISTTGGTVICYNTTGSPATNGTTGCTTGTLYTAPVTVSASESLFAVAGGTGLADSTVNSAAYVITSPPQVTIKGTVDLTGSGVTLK